MFRLGILLEDMQYFLDEAEKNLVLFIQTKDSSSKKPLSALHGSTA
jgi:hypothetical protein